MVNKLFVGGLAYSVTDEELNEFFAAVGTVLSASVIKDRETGRSKGFGFVEMEDADLAQKAIDALNGKELNGRTVAVSEAKPRTDRSNDRRDFGGRRDRY